MWVVRILEERKAWMLMVITIPQESLKNSPYYNPSAINDVHIPINKPTNFPGVD